MRRQWGSGDLSEARGRFAQILGRENRKCKGLPVGTQRGTEPGGAADQAWPPDWTLGRDRLGLGSVREVIMRTVMVTTSSTYDTLGTMIPLNPNS